MLTALAPHSGVARLTLWHDHPHLVSDEDIAVDLARFPAWAPYRPMWVSPTPGALRQSVREFTDILDARPALLPVAVASPAAAVKVAAAGSWSLTDHDLQTALLNAADTGGDELFPIRMALETNPVLHPDVVAALRKHNVLAHVVTDGVPVDKVTDSVAVVVLVDRATKGHSTPAALTRLITNPRLTLGDVEGIQRHLLSDEQAKLAAGHPDAPALHAALHAALPRASNQVGAPCRCRHLSNCAATRSGHRPPSGNRPCSINRSGSSRRR